MRVPRSRPAAVPRAGTQPGRHPRRLPRTLAGQLFAMQVVLVTVVVAGCAVFAYVSDRLQAEESARHRARATALAVADSPSVQEAIGTAHPTAALQPYAEQVRRDTGVTFITIMDTDRRRWTHPDTDRIGERFVGHIGSAPRGRPFEETYTGTLGPSVRVVVPVRAESDDRRIVGMVSAGIAVETISEEIQRQVVALLLVAGGALALGGLGTYVINARLRRTTHGMNAAELSRMHDYHQATLHAVREGLLMLDGQRRVALINDGARELLGLAVGEREVVGLPVGELGLPDALTAALLAVEPRVDEVHLTAERVVVVNTSPVDGGERSGTVVTLRDHTELQSLAGELDSVRGFAEALRSQAHEAANRLHTVVSLIELGRTREAVEFATEELELAQALTDQVVTAVAEPVLAALLLGKAAQANERGVELALSPGSRLDHLEDEPLPDGLAGRDLVTLVGNLIDNAVEAAASGSAAARRVTVTVVRGADGALLLRVGDTGDGVPPGSADVVFERGWSTKDDRPAHGIGLALVRQTARRHGGTVEVGTSPEGGAEFTVRIPQPRGGRGTAEAGEAGETGRGVRA